MLARCAGEGRTAVMVVATQPKSITGDSWCTPKWLADLLGRFDLDPCSNERSHIIAGLYCRLDAIALKLRDGLALDWEERSVYVNPPFSDVGPWATKLAGHAGAWCALVKLDPSTRWFATLMSANPTVAPFKKRIKFEGDRAMTANFPCALVFKRWEPSDELAQHLWMRRWG